MKLHAALFLHLLITLALITPATANEAKKSFKLDFDLSMYAAPEQNFWMVDIPFPGLDPSQFGELIIIPPKPVKQNKTPLEMEIDAYLKKHDTSWVTMINNRGGRALNNEGRLTGMEDLGRVVYPMDVLTISDSRVPPSISKLCGAIKTLPESADVVRLIYTPSTGWHHAMLHGYTIEKPRDNPVKFVKYDKVTPWREWIIESFKKDDEE